MRTIPVDMSRVSFIGTGKAVERAEYVELSDGSRKRSGNQAKDESGVPLWTVDVIVDDDDAMRAEAVGVTIASHDEPRCEKWKPVKFRDLVATIYVEQGTNRAKVSLKASGIDGAHPNPKPQAA
ncbi:hypothetical protein [Pseudonocardia sp. T1-2H]|uniref:hypothetical protein n=1 Tax=Pseudonocardia sp. T1-2H TaxID=3128899 RepID=UPI00310103D5